MSRRDAPFWPRYALGAEVDTFAMQPMTFLGDLAMDPADPLPYRSTTALLDKLTPGIIEEVAERRPVDRTWRSSSCATVAAHCPAHRREPAPRATLPGEVVLFALGVVTDAAEAARVATALDHIDRTLTANRVGRYPNFVERPAQAREFFDDVTWTRLQAIKASYDPEGIFRGNHPISAD